MRLPGRGRTQLLGLIDQFIMSGATFGAVVILARWSGVFELGLYSLGMTGIVFLVSIEESIVTAPYTVYSNLRRLDAEALALSTGSGLVQTAVLGGLAAAVLLVGGAMLPGDLGVIAAPLAFAIVATLLREFARRQCLAVSRLKLLLTIDGVASAAQLGLLVGLGATGGLTAARALAVLGAAALAGFFLWWFASRRVMRVSAEALAASTELAWAFGRWILLCSIATVVGGYSIHWILASAVGAAATGSFEMVRTLANLFNPVVNGIKNVLGPLSARVVSEEGAAGLGRLVRSSIATFAIFGVLWLVILAGAGRTLLGVTYGAEYASLAIPLLIVGAANVVIGLGIPADQALWALEAPRVNAVAALLAVPVIVGLTIAVMPSGPVLAGAVGLASGRTLETATRYVGLSRTLRPWRRSVG